LRFYQIIIPGAPGAFTRVPGEPGETIWSSRINGQHNPEAQQVEFSIEEMSPTASPSANSTITVQGVSWDQIKQTNGLIKCPIIVHAGMDPGLPIASAQAPKAGLIMQGSIQKAWGNWVGTDMSIGMSFIPAGFAAAAQGQDGSGSSSDGGGGSDSSSAAPSIALDRVNRTFRGVGARSIDRRAFARGSVSNFSGVSIPGIGNIGNIANISALISGPAGFAGSASAGGFTRSSFGGGTSGLSLISPLNLIHNLMPKMPLSSAIQQTLSKAFKGAGVNVKILDALRLGYQDAGMYQSLEQYAQYVHKLSNSIAGTNRYMGVHMSSYSNNIDVWDGTKSILQGTVSYVDLIGQPTWVDYMKVSVKCMIRGDLHIASEFTLPDGIVALTSEAILPGVSSQQRTNLSLPGKYWITKVLHIGDYRNPDGNAWSTNYEAVYEGTAGGIFGTLENIGELPIIPPDATAPMTEQ
jgi:hypothetical protein